VKLSTTVQQFRDAYVLVSNTLDKKKSAGGELFIQAIETTPKAPSRALLFSSDGMALTVLRLDAKVKQAGAALLYFKDFGASLSALPPTADLAFSMQANRLQLKSDHFRPSCPVNAAGFTMRQELLKAIPFGKAPAIIVSSSKLLDCLERTAAFASRDDQLDQLFLHQVLLVSRKGALEAYSTNSKVAAKARIEDAEITEGFSMEIPVHSVGSLVRILGSYPDTPVSIITRNNEATGEPAWLYFRCGYAMFGTALMEGSLPSKIDQVEAMVGKSKASVTLDRKAFLDMLTRCTPFIAAREELSLSLSKQTLTVYNDVGEELDRMDGANNECEEICEVTLSRDWVAGAVKAMKDQELVLHFSQAQKKAIWLTSGKDDTGRSFYLITTKVEAKKNLAPKAKPTEEAVAV